jgi:hypothetical protein
MGGKALRVIEHGGSLMLSSPSGPRQNPLHRTHECQPWPTDQAPDLRHAQGNESSRLSLNAIIVGFGLPLGPILSVRRTLSSESASTTWRSAESRMLTGASGRQH